MENYEDLFHKLEEFERAKPKELSKDLEEFIGVVAKTGDPIYPWPKIKCVYRLKIMSVLSQFYEAGPSTDTSQFSFESMKSKILERFDVFRRAPFTIQRLSELLMNPRKEYNRIDKFMRAIEKNLLVVSVAEPGCSKHVNLNGSVDNMEEGFQVSSTSVYDEYCQRVAGLMEHEVAAAAISEDGPSEIHCKGSPIRCKRSDEELRVDGDCAKKDEENSHEPSIGSDGEATQARLTANQGAMLDHQEFHRLEFSLAEPETLSIVEIVTEDDCPTTEVSEDSGKDYPIGNQMIENSAEVNDSVVGPVISDVDSCDSVTEVVATESSGSATLDDDLPPSDKANHSDKDPDENSCSDVSTTKEESLSNNIESNERLENQNIDVMDIGPAVEAQPEGESDSVTLSNSSKVLVIASPIEPEFAENVIANPLCSLEATEKIKEEYSYLETSKNKSASEEPCDGAEGEDRADVDCQEQVSVESPPEEDNTEIKTSVGRTSPVVATCSEEMKALNEETVSTDKKDDDS